MGQKDQGLPAGGRYQVIPRVLVFLRHGRDVLLLKGAADKRIWANLYNGVGGHVEMDEDILSAARREVAEETGLQARRLGLRAVVNIDAGEKNTGILMFVFVGWSDSRNTTASTEGELRWRPHETLGRLPLVEDLSWLLPRLLAMPEEATPLFLHYYYDESDRLVIDEAPGAL